MISNVTLFNAVMVGFDAVALTWIARRRTAGAWWTGVALGGALSVLMVGWLAHTGFQAATLTADALFLHGCFCLLVAAVLLWRTARRTAVLSALGFVLVAAIAVDAFWIEPVWLEVSHVTLASPKLSRKVRVVVLADFQTNRIGDYERRVVEEVLRQEPDVILLAGDYLDVPPERWESLSRQTNALLKDVKFSAPEGVFAIEGNIDVWHPWPRVFEGLPVVPLRHTQSLEVAGLRLTCLSIYDSCRAGLRLENGSPEQFHVVLGHVPNFALGQIEADLLLAGHTHGGQVCLPGIGALTNGCSIPLAWTSGLTELESGAKLLVSRGAGMERGSAPEIRFLCRPEIVVLDLVPELPAD